MLILCIPFSFLLLSSLSFFFFYLNNDIMIGTNGSPCPNDVDQCSCSKRCNGCRCAACFRECSDCLGTSSAKSDDEWSYLVRCFPWSSTRTRFLALKGIQFEKHLCPIDGGSSQDGRKYASDSQQHVCKRASRSEGSINHLYASFIINRNNRYLRLRKKCNPDPFFF